VTTTGFVERQAALFDGRGAVSAGTEVQAGYGSESVDGRAARTRGSVLWAAYGDALGFVSELTNERGLRRRTNGAELDRLMGWTRRVGGRRGVDAALPAGCWSDDTQLRMAVSRAIGCRGFDVEMFSRIELPVWLSYALGGGRATKAAAANLGKPRSLWYANTFRGWAGAGGNGAAMRVQPHVWASSDLDGGYMLDVITDSVCTHGHPRAIVGACFHAATLAHCLRDGAVPGPSQCEEIAEGLTDAPSLIENHRSLGSTWIALWEQETGANLRDAWRATVEELRAAIGQAADCANGAEGTVEAYREISARLGLTDEERRGSGILTPVAAVTLAATATNAHDAAVAAANEIGTDTDTIATMSGALLGACEGATEPPEKPLDSDYLLREADRLVAASRGETAGGYSYPDVLTWTAPRTQADALVSTQDRLVVEGLGEVTKLDADLLWASGKDFAWQWVRTDFGQTLLIKRRPNVRSPRAENELAPPALPPSETSAPSADRTRGASPTTPRRAAAGAGTKIEGSIRVAMQNISDNERLGYVVRRVAREGSLDDLVALVTSLREHLRL